MTTIIETLQQLISKLPLTTRMTGPCPFCESGDGKHVVYDGVDFYWLVIPNIGACIYYMFLVGFDFFEKVMDMSTYYFSYGACK